MRQVSMTQRQWDSKHLTGWCGIGIEMKQWKFRSTHKCPRCGKRKDVRHIWRCKGRGTLVTWEESLNTLQQSMGRLQTSPQLTRIVLSRLMSWKHAPPLDRFTSQTPGLQEASNDQDRIG